MLIHRRTFLDVGGFDPAFFAYFEDVDLGWRLWVLGHKVVYAPGAVVRHIGGSTGTRQPAYRRYTLWECNSLATVLKNYESGNVERILSAALMLLYKRALLAAGDAFDPADYELTAPRDQNPHNVERLPRISVAHLAAIDRFNSLLPRFMQERREIQARRVRSDREILPLLGRLWEAQFAGSEYAGAARQLAATLDLYGITEATAPNRVLIVATASDPLALALTERLSPYFHVALAQIEPGASHTSHAEPAYVRHLLDPSSAELRGLYEQADAVLVLSSTLSTDLPSGFMTPIALVGDGALPDGFSAHFASIDDTGIEAFCRAPMLAAASRSS
jgi:hypothetical protein